MDAEARAAAWTFVVVLGGLKLGAACLIFWMQPSGQSAVLLVALHGYWLAAPFFLLAVLPTLYWLRLLRARARRRRLIRSEWQVEERPTGWKTRIARGTM
jgi:hypothetical protein